MYLIPLYSSKPNYYCLDVNIYSLGHIYVRFFTSHTFMTKKCLRTNLNK